MVSSRGVLLMLNAFFFLMGVGILSIGLWSQFDKNFSMIWSSFEINKLVEARGLNGASLLLLISGFLSVFISFIGLYGSIKKDKCFLGTYCILICIILILEISAISVFYNFQTETRTTLKKSLNETVAKINEDNDKTSLGVMNTVQTLFKCCGCNGPSDYLNVTQMTTCLASNSTQEHPSYYQTGCYDSILAFVNTNLTIILGLSICIMIFQFFCLIMSVKTCMQKRPEGYEDI